MIIYHCPKCDLDIEKSECSVCKSRAEVTSLLYWCNHCNIPTYDEICPLCHTRGKYFTSDARPVFPQERLLIEIMLGKPLAFINDSVWNGSGNRFYVNGKKIPLKVTELSDYQPTEIRKALKQYTEQNSANVFVAYINTWIQANSQRFHFVTTEAKEYINNYANRFSDNEEILMFVSFSGGKDYEN